MALSEIIDSHHHLASPQLSYPWLEGPAEPFKYHGDDRPLRRPYLVDDYLTDVGDLKLLASVHVENGAADPIAETRFIDQVSRDRGIPTVHVAKVSLLAQNATEQLDQQADFKIVRGIRDILNWHPEPLYSHTPRPDIIIDPVWRKNFAGLANRKLSFDLQVFPSQLQQAAELAAEFQNTQIILDHIGMPIGRDESSFKQWVSGLKAVASNENAVVKISAIGTNDHFWNVESIRQFVLQTIEIFGTDRCMFGSNFPVDGLYSDFATLYAAFDEITIDFSESERRDLFVQTAARTYRITLD